MCSCCFREETEALREVFFSAKERVTSRCCNGWKKNNNSVLVHLWLLRTYIHTVHGAVGDRGLWRQRIVTVTDTAQVAERQCLSICRSWVQAWVLLLRVSSSFASELRCMYCSFPCTIRVCSGKLSPQCLHQLQAVKTNKCPLWSLKLDSVVTYTCGMCTYVRLHSTAINRYTCTYVRTYVWLHRASVYLN